MDISYISLRRYVNIRKWNVNFSRIKIFTTIRVLFMEILCKTSAKRLSTYGAQESVLKAERA